MARSTKAGGPEATRVEPIAVAGATWDTIPVTRAACVSGALIVGSPRLKTIDGVVINPKLALLREPVVRRLEPRPAQADGAATT